MMTFEKRFLTLSKFVKIKICFCLCSINTPLVFIEHIAFFAKEKICFCDILLMLCLIELYIFRKTKLNSDFSTFFNNNFS